jgi:hypothetical protein
MHTLKDRHKQYTYAIALQYHRAQIFRYNTEHHNFIYLFELIYRHGERRQVVSTVTRLRVGRSGIRIPAVARYLSVLQNVQTGSRTHPASFSTGTGGPSLRAKWAGSKADHSHPPGPEAVTE